MNALLPGIFKDYVNIFQSIAPEVDAAATRCAGGLAAFTGLESPLTTIKGSGPEITEQDIDQAIAFFRERGAKRVTFELAEWISATTRERFLRRGFEVTAMENVVARRLPCEVSSPKYSVSVMDADPWSHLMQEGFELPAILSSRYLTQAAALLPGAVNSGVRDDDLRWVGCAQLIPSAGVAIFCCAAVPDARGRGVHTALIQERLRHAGRSSLSWAAAEVAPGSASERNYLRCGFNVAYARTHYSIGIS